MVQKSYGKMRGTRKKMTSRGRPSIASYLRKFSDGDTVHIRFVPSSRMQHPRFHGLTGTVVKKEVRNYVVRVRDGNVYKKIYARPEHLTLQVQK